MATANPKDLINRPDTNWLLPPTSDVVRLRRCWSVGTCRASHRSSSRRAQMTSQRSSSCIHERRLSFENISVIGEDHLPSLPPPLFGAR